MVIYWCFFIAELAHQPGRCGQLDRAANAGLTGSAEQAVAALNLKRDAQTNREIRAAANAVEFDQALSAAHSDQALDSRISHRLERFEHKAAQKTAEMARKVKAEQRSEADVDARLKDFGGPL